MAEGLRAPFLGGGCGLAPIGVLLAPSSLLATAGATGGAVIGDTRGIAPTGAGFLGYRAAPSCTAMAAA